MSDSTDLFCETCNSTRQVRFCRDCAHKICSRCVIKVQKPVFYCNVCDQDREGVICGSCGSDCDVEQYQEEKACPSCEGPRLADPETLINNLPSDYYQVINKVKEIIPDLIDLYRSFDFMVGMVRFFRLAGFLGFPQMEIELQKCSDALEKINDRSIRELNQIRKEGLYDIRRLDYFKDIDLNHVRNFEAVLQSTDDKIQQLATHIRFWISQVKNKLDNLKPLAFFLRKHFDHLAEINRYMPDGIHDVAAILPPIGMNIRVDEKVEKGKIYIIFAEEYCVFLPKRAVDPNYVEIINGIKIPYEDFKNRKRKSSILKGTQLVIELESGQISVSAPPQVLDRVEEYFGLIDSDEPYMVGSPKKIREIEAQAPDKNEYRRATRKFINIFREWLFGDPVQKPETRELQYPSMKELMQRLRQLEQAYKQINLKAANMQIGPDEYQNETKSIKDDYQSIKDSLQKLSGHFGSINEGLSGA